MADNIFTRTASHAPNREMFTIKNFILTEPKKLKSNRDLFTNFIFEGLALLICLNGRGKIRVNYHEYDIEKNQLMVIMPFQLVSQISHDEEAFGAGLFIGMDYMVDAPVVVPDLDRLIRFGSYPIITLTDDEMENLMELHSVILTRYNRLGRPYTTNSLKALMLAFMAEISSIWSKSEPTMVQPVTTRSEKITSDFFKLLISNFKEQRSVAWYADKLCYTPKYLSSVVKKVTGHTIQDWINEIVILHIKNLLRTTDKTVLEISKEMNFSNPSFFGRFFKQYTGMTPKKYRFS